MLDAVTPESATLVTTALLQISPPCVDADIDAAADMLTYCRAMLYYAVLPLLVLFHDCHRCRCCRHDAAAID